MGPLCANKVGGSFRYLLNFRAAAWGPMFPRGSTDIPFHAFRWFVHTGRLIACIFLAWSWSPGFPSGRNSSTASCSLCTRSRVFSCGTRPRMPLDCGGTGFATDHSRTNVLTAISMCGGERLAMSREVCSVVNPQRTANRSRRDTRQKFTATI